MPTVLVTGASRGHGARVLPPVPRPRGGGCSRPCAIRTPHPPSTATASSDSVWTSAIATGSSELARELEGSAIDLLVNNAGLWAGDEEEGFGGFSDERWMEQLRVHVLGTMAMCEAFAPHVAASGKKLIVQISSGNGSLSREENAVYYPYNSTKAALNMITRGMAFDLRGRGVTVVALSPGYVATDMSGPDADLGPEESVSAMRALIERLGPADSGGFRRHTGEVYPW